MYTSFLGFWTRTARGREMLSCDIPANSAAWLSRGCLGSRTGMPHTCNAVVHVSPALSYVSCQKGQDRLRPTILFILPMCSLNKTCKNKKAYKKEVCRRQRFRNRGNLTSCHMLFTGVVGIRMTKSKVRKQSITWLNIISWSSLSDSRLVCEVVHILLKRTRNVVASMLRVKCTLT